LQSVDFEMPLCPGVTAISGALLGIDPEKRGHSASLRMHGSGLASCATRAPCISPSRALVAASPVGARPAGKVRVWPNSVTDGSPCDLRRNFAPKSHSVQLIGVRSILFGRCRLNPLARAACLWLMVVIGGARLFSLMAVCAEISVAVITLPPFPAGGSSRDHRAEANDSREAGDGTQR
jgi:hypothetical protein